MPILRQSGSLPPRPQRVVESCSPLDAVEIGWISPAGQPYDRFSTTIKTIAPPPRRDQPMRRWHTGGELDTAA